MRCGAGFADAGCGRPTFGRLGLERFGVSWEQRQNRHRRGLVVLGREVGDTGWEATGWGFAFECGVGSSVVVAVEEGLEGSGSFGVG
jgi:hypothetical protein